MDSNNVPLLYFHPPRDSKTYLTRLAEHQLDCEFCHSYLNNPLHDKIGPCPYGKMLIVRCVLSTVAEKKGVTLFTPNVEHARVQRTATPLVEIINPLAEPTYEMERRLRG